MSDSDDQLPKQLSGLSRLVQIEWEARQAASDNAIFFIAVNDTHRLVGYDHAILWRAAPGLWRPHEGRIAAISGGLKIEKHAPQIVWFNKVATYLALKGDAETAHAIDAKTLPATLAAGFDQWIGGEALWVPISGPKSRLEGALILLRNTAFNDAEQRTLARLGNAYGSALTALSAPPGRRRDRIHKKHIGFATGILCIAALTFVRIPMTILAEARVAPSDPILIAAPIDGVISQIVIRPNQEIAAGQLLLRFDATELHAAKEVALKRVAVLSADSQRAEAQAFTDAKERAQINLLRAKLSEGEAELVYARERLAKTSLHAQAAGVALIDDVNQWIGRPVKVGERIMIIADPSHARLEIEVAVEDALYAAPGAKVDFFLATAPSQPIAAELTDVSYSAALQPDQSAKFIAEARFAQNGSLPRLGLTGTARIRGARVSLGYLLFRKPLAKLRRLFGI